MAPAPPAQLIIAFPKAIEAIVFYIMAFMVKNRGGKAFKDQYILNRTFFVGFLGWAICMTLDIFLYMIAPLSFNPNVAVYAAGYDFTYPSLVIANFLRDISMIGGYVHIWCLLIAAYIIRHGMIETNKHLTQNWVFYCIVGAYGAFFIITDSIFVQIVPGQPTVVNAVFSGISLVTLTITISLYWIGAAFFYRTAHIQIYSAEPVLQHRIKLLSYGVILFGSILVYWLLIGMVETLPEIGPVVVAWDIPLEILGHGIWTIAPILMYGGLRDPRKIENVAGKLDPTSIS